jgi:hypothetical protein
MKFKYFLVLVVAGLMITSCSTEFIDPVSDKVGVEDRDQLTLVGINGTETRISIGDKTGNTYPMLWTEGDVIGLFSKTSGTDILNVPARLRSGDGGSNQGIFTSADLVLGQGAIDLAIYYPFDEWSDNISIDVDSEIIEATLPAIQSQSAPDNSDHIGNYGVAYAKATTTGSNSPVQFSLSHPLAYLKIKVSSTELSSYKLQGVSLYDMEGHAPSLAGKFKVDITSHVLTRDTEAGDRYVTVQIENPKPLSSAQEVYLTSLPVDFDNKEVYVVVELINDQQHTATIPVKVPGKKLEANSLSVIEINDLKLSDNPFDWYEPIETRLLAGGWAYGTTNTVLLTVSSTGTEALIDVKARGNFMRVQKPLKVGVTWGGEHDTRMVAANNIRMETNTAKGEEALPLADIINSQISVKAYDSGQGGLGAVSIYGEEDEFGTRPIIWTFNVWGTTDVAQDHEYRSSGYTVLDRNIGAGRVEEGSWRTNGNYFQWGRVTGFPWGAGSFYSTPAFVQDMQDAIEMPRHMFYTSGVENTSTDWWLGAWTGKRSDRKDDLWGNPNTAGTNPNSSDGHKSIYDPCPKGYRVVSPKVLKEIQTVGEVVEWKNANGAIAQRFLKYTYDGVNYAIWPYGGCRYGNGAQDRHASNTLTGFHYWSNSPASNYENEDNPRASSFVVELNNDGTLKSQSEDMARAHALSVRCMRDIENR